MGISWRLSTGTPRTAPLVALDIMWIFHTETTPSCRSIGIGAELVLWSVGHRASMPWRHPQIRAGLKHLTPASAHAAGLRITDQAGSTMARPHITTILATNTLVQAAAMPVDSTTKTMHVLIPDHHLGEPLLSTLFTTPLPLLTPGHEHQQCPWSRHRCGVHQDAEIR